MHKFIIIILLLFSASAFAQSGLATGKVIGYIPYSQGVEEMFFINIENLSNTPSCNTTLRLTMKSNNPRYKATQAAVLAALMSGMKVKAKGNGTCNNIGNSEDLRLICLGDTPC